jgi:hypothetical protein
MVAVDDHVRALEVAGQVAAPPSIM